MKFYEDPGKELKKRLKNMKIDLAKAQLIG